MKNKGYIYLPLEETLEGFQPLEGIGWLYMNEEINERKKTKE